MTIDEEFRNYKRFPIQIGRTTFVLLHMFEYHPDHIEDVMLPEELEHKMSNVDYEAAVEQFIKQFEGNACRLFFMKLRDKCDEYIKVEEAEIAEKTNNWYNKLDKPKDE